MNNDDNTYNLDKDDDARSLPIFGVEAIYNGIKSYGLNYDDPAIWEHVC